MAAKTSTCSPSSAGTSRAGTTGVQGDPPAGDAERGDLPEGGQVEHARNLVEVVGAEADAGPQELPHRGGHGLLDLEADRGAEAPPPELLLDGREEVPGLVLLDVEVGVAGDPEHVGLHDLDAREERVQVGGDHLLQGDVDAPLHLDQAGQDRRHLDPREPLLACHGVGHGDRQREAQRADVGERVAGCDGERREDREDLLEVSLAQAGVVLRDLGVVDDGNALGGEAGANLAEEPAVLGDQVLDAVADGRELLAGGPAVGGELRAGRGDLLHEPGDADLEELVEVGSEDRQELRPLQERVALVARLVEDAGVEVEPRELAVDVGEGGVAASPRSMGAGAEGGHGRAVRGSGCPAAARAPAHVAQGQWARSAV
jgi:hypothetical protein